MRSMDKRLDKCKVKGVHMFLCSFTGIIICLGKVVKGKNTITGCSKEFRQVCIQNSRLQNTPEPSSIVGNLCRRNTIILEANIRINKIRVLNISLDKICIMQVRNTILGE